MKTLVVSDIHESIDRAQEVLDTPHEWDKVVFLGDYFDSFYESPFKEVLSWLESKYNEYGDLATWLVGNHEIHYIVEAYSRLEQARKMWDLPFGCSGYSRKKAKKIRRSDFIKNTFFPNLKICHLENDVIFSHAGFCNNHFLPRYDVGKNIDLWNKEWGLFFSFLKANVYPTNNIWKIGIGRDGKDNLSSPIWTDYDFEFVESPLTNVTQIFGHTYGKTTRILREKGVHICLDTGLAYYAIIDEKEVKIFDSLSHEEARKAKKYV